MQDLLRFKIVICDCPYDTWGEDLTKEIFHKVVRLKILGYQREYPYGVLPIDTSDFIGTHHIVCIEEGNSLEPIMAYRSITLARSRVHHLALPVLTLMKLMGESKHEEAIQRIIEDCDRRKKEISYVSSLTVRSDFKGNLEIRDILKAIHVLYHREYDICEIIGGGVLRFKVDQFYKFWGYEPLQGVQKEILPPLPVPFVFDEVTGFFHLKEFSAEAKAFAEKYRELWDDRITIGDGVPKERKRAA